ncbi:LysR family transcriptional regulator [Paraferrimonas sedimenticola]|uniref:LysR family transcriptional regulator n=1 Tax=Paraferrimonas sedimenticola TaxID=375674 RepID=A0AA37RUJ4_9GAMM|nr:LysR family transcriptional regulator [Paraferrimonas sedimenticola]GLP95494.1 LysR family transcriptional regulator [Paraferrimonas sedimenticola]
MMLKFFDVKVFVLACELKNLSAVARELGITPAAASAALKRLELALDTRLLQRSTRSLTLTQQGQSYLPHALKALESLEVGRQAVSGEQLKGNITLSVPSDFGRNSLLPILLEFQKAHPDIALKVRLSDKYVDFYSQAVDVALRYGEPEDSSLVSLPLVRDGERVLCASPDYLERWGTPQHPQDLIKHNCLHYSGDDTLDFHWRFYKDGQRLSVKVQGDHLSDDGDYIRQLAIAGAGIAYKTGYDVKSELADGRLVALLPDYQKEKAPLHMVVAHRLNFDASLMALRQHLLTALKDA